MRPTPQQISEDADRIRAIDVRDMERRLKAAIARDKAGTTTADGFPSSTLPGGHGGSELTSVESAASRRLSRRDDDPAHRNLEYAVGYWQQAASSLNAAYNMLDLAEKAMAAPTTIVKACESCVAAERQDPQPPTHTSTVAGRLSTDRDLCDDCYWFIYRLPVDEGRFPSVEEMARYVLTGKWRQRVS